jgi:hypothetical protein
MKTAKQFRIWVAMIFLGLFCVIAMTPKPAEAQYVVTVVSNPADQTNWLTQLANDTKDIAVLGDIFSFLANNVAPLISAGNGSIIGGLQVMTTGIFNASQAIMDNTRFTAQITFAAQRAAASTLSPLTGVCAANYRAMAYDKAQNARMAIQHAAEVQEVLKNKGVGANNGPVLSAERMADVCALGFVTANEYGSLPQQLGNCTPDPLYPDADELESSLFGNFLQFPVPKSIIVTADQNIFFALKQIPPGARVLPNGGGSPNPTDSSGGVAGEKDFIAAYKYCMSLPAQTPTPVYSSGSTPATLSAIENMDADRRNAAQGAGARAACLGALWFRTACPANSQDNFKALSGSSDNCHNNQVALCNSLRNCPNAGVTQPAAPGSPPAPPCTNAFVNPGDSQPVPGMGITDNPYLKDCDTNGLSQAMYESIESNPCMSQAYMQNVLPTQGTAEETERFSRNGCKDTRTAFQNRLDNQKRDVDDARRGMPNAGASSISNWQAGRPIANP